MMGRSARMLQLDLAMLCIFKNIQEDEVIQALEKLFDGITDKHVPLHECVKQYNEVIYTLANKQPTLSLKAYIQRCLVYGDNLLGLMIERGQELSEAMLEQIRRELRVLEGISNLKASDMKEQLCLKGQDRIEKMMLVERLLEWQNELTAEENLVLGASDWEEKLVDLLYFYKTYGSGIYARYKVFYIDGQGELQGARSREQYTLDYLIGYPLQKQELLHNTKLFVQGKPANNVLLYGARGTGKSTMVKALMQEKALGNKLRMIEIRKDQVMSIKQLFAHIKQKPYRFILFIDDLAFEERGETYTMLKTVLEGGVEAKPDNVLIYATSNRRHLVKEYMGDNELHGSESTEEKLSLSDRFGLRIYLATPNQQEYLAIVNGLARQEGIEVDAEALKRQALQWEMWNNGKSGRTAKQFIDSLGGR